AIMMYFVSKRWLAPLLLALIDEKMQKTDNMMKSAASAMGIQSGESRQLKKLEKMVIEDLLEEYPEIELALDRFSPDTADYMRKNPRAAMHLYRRWKPFLDDVLGGVTKGDHTPYDIG
ncbi:unnamed protein product, partial [marine sediment metagenome]